jgi:hypothetical protein
MIIKRNLCSGITSGFGTKAMIEILNNNHKFIEVIFNMGKAMIWNEIFSRGQ